MPECILVRPFREARGKFSFAPRQTLGGTAWNLALDLVRQPRRHHDPLYGMAVLFTLLGVGLILIAVLDIFQTLFHPAGRGAMSDWTAHLVWKCFRRIAERYSGVLTYAGPVAILLIISTWTACTLVGFALVYLPHMGSQYVYDPGINPANHRGFWEAMNASIGALMTLSQGMAPKSAWLGLVRGLEAIIGFGLLTASVSWLLSIYPVIEARRSAAERASLLHGAELRNQIDLVHDCGDRAHEWIMALAADIASIRNQMAQFPISYYFHVGEPQTSLAGTLPYLYELADRAVASKAPPARLAATALGGAVEDFLKVLAEVFLRIETTDKQEILKAYAHEHMSDMILRGETISYAP